MVQGGFRAAAPCPRLPPGKALPAHSSRAEPSEPPRRSLRSPSLNPAEGAGPGLPRRAPPGPPRPRASGSGERSRAAPPEPRSIPWPHLFITFLILWRTLEEGAEMPLLPPPLPPSAGRFSMVATTWLGCGGWCGGGGGCGGGGWRWWRWRSGESIAAGLRLSGERGASRREGGGRCCRRRWLPWLPGSARPSPAPPSLGCHAARGGLPPQPPASAVHGRRSGSTWATLLLLPTPPAPSRCLPPAEPPPLRRLDPPLFPARHRPAQPLRTAAAAARPGPSRRGAARRRRS